MPTSKRDPIVEFLLKDENLVPALQVFAHAKAVRGKVSERFWGALKDKILEKLQEVPVKFSWLWLFEEKLNEGAAEKEWRSRQEARFEGVQADECFGLIALPAEVRNSQQGLKYMIEVCPDYFGFGIVWLSRPAKDFEALSGKCGIALSASLKNRTLKFETQSKWWFRWEYLDRDPYQEDPWVWFADGFFKKWSYETVAEQFCAFVKATHAGVAAANQTLS